MIVQEIHKKCGFIYHRFKCIIVYKVGRYDIKGKQYLAKGSKYDVADIGPRYFLLGTKHTDMGHILENIVYLELLRRGYEVYVGKVGDAEVDFIAVNAEGQTYYQISQTVMEEQTLKRALSSLGAIKDHNPKYLLTMDYTCGQFRRIKFI
ncbi:DUF4143 domain-containing protein [Fusibacter sp. 3D3]|uniref:DUF4143 domain-containing protein n=1 Tax=Fusibacter sp. 3D3 TaxID=1048380 RepID=UPI000852F067|nr:ATPase component BioM of energizing module of biotin ECF transporter [Fusibacter sp. 3D3]